MGLGFSKSTGGSVEQQEWLSAIYTSLSIDLRYIRGASKKKEKENKHEKKNLAKSDRPTFFLFYFLGAPFKRYARRLWVVCGRATVPPHVGTRSWLRCLPLRASSL